VTPTSARIRAQTYAGHQYQLQRAVSLSSPDWVDVGTAQPGNGGVIEFTDTDPTVGARFYRIKVWP
jgi:hypothetical protein